MQEYLLNFGLGCLIGAIFAILHFRVPAPIDYIGVTAIFGITFGYKLILFFIK